RTRTRKPREWLAARSAAPVAKTSPRRWTSRSRLPGPPGWSTGRPSVEKLVMAKAHFLRRPFLVRSATPRPLIRCVFRVEWPPCVSFLVFLEVGEAPLSPAISSGLPLEISAAATRAWFLYLECGGREHLALLRLEWQQAL